MYQLILGGARSGKSRLAEKLAAESGLAVIYIATSQPLDGEMNERVTLHRQRRPDHQHRPSTHHIVPIMTSALATRPQLSTQVDTHPFRSDPDG